MIGLTKDELGERIITQLTALRPKTYSYLTENSDEKKKAKDTKKCFIKTKLKFEEYKHYLEANQVENEINQLEKKLDMNILQENYKEFIKNDKLILKSQQRFRSEKHYLFTEEINKIIFNSNDDRIIQSIDSIEIYANGASKDLLSKEKKLNVTL